MKIVRASVLGFCSGVRRAVDMAMQISTAECRRVYTLGPLIHNPQVLETLEKRGLICLKEGEIPPEPEKSTVIIRAHGVSPAVEKSLARLGARIVDATCPHVRKSQNKALYYAEKGYRIFLAGEKNHGEIAGIRGYAEACPFSACFVVGSPGEAGEAAAELHCKEPKANVALIGQTTFSVAEYQAIEAAIRKYFPGLVTENSICGATDDRQKALRELCGKVDAIVVAGGKKSSNTGRLLSLARELGKPAWLVETPEEIWKVFSYETRPYETVGLCAGASTPDGIIDEIEQKMAFF